MIAKKNPKTTTSLSGKCVSTIAAPKLNPSKNWWNDKAIINTWMRINSLSVNAPKLIPIIIECIAIDTSNTCNCNNNYNNYYYRLQIISIVVSILRNIIYIVAIISITLI